MGDGRYYTGLQFFNTLFLLMLIMVMTMNLVTILYRHVSNRLSNWLRVIYLSLAGSVLLRLIEEIVVGDLWISYADFLSNCLLLLVCLAIFIVLMVVTSRKKYRGDPVEIIYDNGDLYQILVIYMAFIAGYGMVAVFIQSFVDIYTLFIYGVSAYTLHRLIKVVSPYGISMNLFANTKDMILDYVFILDAQGTLIYQNNNSETSHYFKALKAYDIQDIRSMFNRRVKHQELRGKNYIKYEDLEGPIYFSYFIKPLVRTGGDVGSIITFTDVTGLMVLLENLDQQKEDSERINKELQHYATIVYRLEKEREIQQLLETIAENQEKSMLVLKDELIKTIGLKDDEAYLKQIDEMVVDAKENLRDVREAVNAFRAYYGGNDD